jgi:RNA-directed DNA polymerase
MNLEVETEVPVEMRGGHKGEYRTVSGKVSYGVSNQSSSEDKLLSKTKNLIDQVVEQSNMIAAYERVCANKGTPGIDNRSVHDLADYVNKYWPTIRKALLGGSYHPSPVLRVEIPKPQGGVRPLGIPTVMDRLIQQAVHQVLSPIFEQEFSESSYGFRPGRSAHQAVKMVQSYQREGFRFVVDMDLKSFFDEVNHDILMSLLRRRIADKAVLKLIRSYLRAGIMIGGVCSTPEKGTPQGGPLSPLLSNIMLNELDKELEKRGHKFARYADDCNVYVRTKRSGQRVFNSMLNFVENRLKLKVNYEKSAVDFPARRKFLGFTFSYKGDIRIPKESRKRFRLKVKELCGIGRGRNLEYFIKFKLNPFLKGWFNYYKLADQKKAFAREEDKWIRHRLRKIVWIQWKKPWTRFRNLMKLGIGQERAARSAFNKRSAWFNSGASHMNQALNVEYFQSRELFSLFNRALFEQ